VLTLCGRKQIGLGCKYLRDTVKLTFPNVRQRAAAAEATATDRRVRRAGYSTDASHLIASCGNVLASGSSVTWAGSFTFCSTSQHVLLCCLTNGPRSGDSETPSLFLCCQARARRQLHDDYVAIREQLPAFTAEAESTITQLVRVACSARVVHGISKAAPPAGPQAASCVSARVLTCKGCLSLWQ